MASFFELGLQKHLETIVSKLQEKLTEEDVLSVFANLSFSQTRVKRVHYWWVLQVAI